MFSASACCGRLWSRWLKADPRRRRLRRRLPLPTMTALPRRLLSLRNPPQRQVEPAIFREEARTAGHDLVDAVEEQPAFAPKHHCVAWRQTEGERRILSALPA